jgi:UDP-glucose:(glucosyl)LPS alpha-1,2-glucosyltransferase
LKEKQRIIDRVEGDKTRPVLFSESFGGSENQLRLLFKHVSDKNFENINLILNNANPDLIDNDRVNILWMQHFVNQKEALNLGSKDFVDKLDFIVFNSNWNFEKFQYQFKVPDNKSIVIKNAIEKIEYKEKTRDKINLIYHSTPWRGLELLLEVFKKINLKDVELNICSSTSIYGKKFSQTHNDKYQHIFDECKKMKNVNYYGFMQNDKIINLLKEMHICSFPSIWPETSCISAIESMAAGCQMVTTNLGALYETCAPFGTFVGFDKNLNNLSKKYELKLIDSINNFWSKNNQDLLNLQRETINRTYSWETRSKEWIDFLSWVKR